jgi:thioredoxin reductase
MVLGCKISVDEFVDGGLTVKDSQKIAQDLEAHGVDYITASAAIYSPTLCMMITPMGFPLGHLEGIAASIKEVVDIPVGVIGSINDPVMAEEILKRNSGDFIVVGRQLIADPAWANKAKEERTDDIRTCIRCNQGCLDRIFDGLNITCSVNPAVLREKEATITPAEKGKKIVIVGGGPAGMEAARVAALRGHDVSMYEKRGQLGGQVLLASKAPGRQEFAELINWQERQLKKLKIKVFLNQEATPQMIKKLKPDSVIVAAGSVPAIPNILGARGENVVNAFEILREEVEVGQKVVILGRDTWALETAEMLIGKGKDVTVIGGGTLERDDDPWEREFATDIHGFTDKFVWFPKLEKSGINFVSKKVVKEITPSGVIINRAGYYCANKQDTRHGVDPLDEKISADTVVLAVGKRPTYADPYEAFANTAKEIYAVGECAEFPLHRRPRAMLAVADGFWLGLKI